MPQADGQTATDWRQTLLALFERRVIAMLFLGFSAGLPLLLIFSSLSLWLREAGIERNAVTFFSWAALGYSFKFVWAPLVDRLPLPLLTRALGRRRGWLLLAQLGVSGAIALMAFTDPAGGESALARMALAATLLGLTAATQDIVIDALRIESAPARLQALMSSTYIAGYRIGMVVSGAGALYLAAWFGSTAETYSYSAWRNTYLVMAATLGVGLVTTLLMREPETRERLAHPYPGRDYLRLVVVFVLVAASFVSAFFLGAPLFAAPAGDALLRFVLEVAHLAAAIAVAATVGWGLVRLGLLERRLAHETWIEPVADFFSRYGLRTALLLLALIGLYRISDIVLGVIANVFYQDIGFTKPQIASAVKTFGVLVSILGGLLGGVLATRFGVMRILLLGALLSALTNLVFVLLAYAGNEPLLLYLAVSADNLAAGLASAAFVAFLSSLTSISFTAVQYAIFSSLMTLLPKVLGGYSGSLVDGLGYPGFFVFTTLIGIPVVALVWRAGRLLRDAP
ncbi:MULTISPECIES: MFS transporter [Marichromatium]|uniref:PAT family beta-lactamase induction signal transducer AmpG n=1 Tax=Marichromatium gracile TaxID=1048 RepID=A0A4R4A7T6_MARGR|nr:MULTISPECIES: MFS transporter [Marichromatium]MBK1710016.1 MFS transporter [Marichromatium gracile]RNE90648.1 MFS transporter [Marichromatium sp. AB31]RNE92803.1 MFS transporter [Marichromatium sp. AB32]TCW34549.1 PAT family beta-lactamase induction signal transducer AmpG [Marichromatium gracile]